MWAATVERSAILQATSREIIAESLMLTVRARELCDARQLCGGSDAEPRQGLARLIVSVILKRPTCLTCIAAKVGASALSVVRTIEGIGESVKVQLSNNERCRMCGSMLDPTYSLPR
jgi:hypothetical protein